MTYGNNQLNKWRYALDIVVVGLFVRNFFMMLIVMLATFVTWCRS